MIWFLYTQWSDIMTFSWDCGCYLLQGRKNKITRATHFRTVSTRRIYQVASPGRLEEKHLQDACLWEAWVAIKQRRQDAE